MTISIYRKQKTDKLKNKAVALYKQGLSLRQVAGVIKRSHNWVATTVREKLSTV